MTISIGMIGTAGRTFSMKIFKRILALTILIVVILAVTYFVFTYGELQKINI
jgi:uncharacterized membrane protein